MTNISTFIGSALIMLCAVGLMALEAFIPGISLAGIGGLALMGFSTYLCWNTYGTVVGILMLILGGVCVFLVMRWVFRSMKNGKLSNSGIFLDTESAPIVQTAPSVSLLTKGAVGITQTALRPTGIALFEGERIHVIAENGFVEQGISVQIVQIIGTHITVSPVSSEN